MEFGPDGNFYVSSWADDNVYRYNGTTGAFIDQYVSVGLGTLNTAEYFAFLPGHQVMVVAAATAVELVSFEAHAQDGAVDLVWQTGTELDNLGFHLYRSLSESGPYERITTSLMPGLGSSPEGARYGYRDVGLVNGVTCFYLLEDVETTGHKKRHGPVSAVPQPGLGVDDGDDSGGTDDGPEDSTAWLRFGDPEAGGLRVLRRTARFVELELVTGGFYGTLELDGAVRIGIPGFDHLPEPGLPAVPSRLAWVEAVAGRGAVVTRVRAADVIGFGLRPADATAPTLLAYHDGTVRSAQRRVRSRFRRGDALFPESPAELVETAFQGETKKALLRLSPLRWDAETGQLLLARRLVVRVAFKGRVPEELGLGGSKGRRARRLRGASGTIAHLATSRPGLHAVSFESVFPGRRRALGTSWLSLTRRGEPVAFRAVPDPDRFGPGSRLLFWSPGPGSDLDVSEAVFVLGQTRGGAVMAERSAAPRGAALAELVATARFEENRRYQPALLEAEDIWLWETIVSPGSRSFPFDLPGVVSASARPATLRVSLQGGSDFPADPDHHVRVLVNGTPVAEASWDGMAPHAIEASLAASLLLQAGNSLTLENAGDTEAPTRCCCWTASRSTTRARPRRETESSRRGPSARGRSRSRVS